MSSRSIRAAGARGSRFFGGWTGARLAIPITAKLSLCHPRDIICEGLRGAAGGAHTYGSGDVAKVLPKIAATLEAAAIYPRGHQYRHKVVGICTSCLLPEWSGPGTLGFMRLAAVGAGQTVAIACQVRGEEVTGSNRRRSDIWDELSGGAFVADFYIDTPGIGALSPPIPPCRDLRVLQR